MNKTETSTNRRMMRCSIAHLFLLIFGTDVFCFVLMYDNLRLRVPLTTSVAVVGLNAMFATILDRGERQANSIGFTGRRWFRNVQAVELAEVGTVIHDPTNGLDGVGK